MSNSIIMYGTATCSDCRRSKSVLEALGVDYQYVDIEASAESADEAKSISGRTSTPVITFPDGTHLVEPSDAELRAKIEALQSA